MENKKVAFYTLGCKVNQYETNAMQEQFLKNGYDVVDFEEKADIYVVNTCTVTNMSDRKSRQILRRVKQIEPRAILVVTGCYAQVAKEELLKIDEVDLVLGNNEKRKIVFYVEKFLKDMQEKQFVADIFEEKQISEFNSVAYTEKTRAMIKIQDGCDRFCSYCIIPYARGRVRSRKVEDIVEEIKQIAKRGIKEVVITGIHIASYGKDFKPHIPLIELLKQVSKIEEIKRIRLGSLEPTLMTKEFISELSNLDKICDHFHLSLQSGCDETLMRMNRKYTTEEFAEGIKNIRKYFPNAALTTDVIVGFPGETMEEFEKTYEYLDKVSFYKMHVFKYSKRNGTKAALMPNQIDGNIKEQRSKKLIELSNKKQKEYNEKQIGKTVEVLVEEKDGKYVKGHTTNYIMVYVEEENIAEYQNKIIQVKVTRFRTRRINR